MIQSDEGVFPNNAVALVAQAMGQIDPDVRVFKRMLRDTDPMQSVGVFPLIWSPSDDSLEIQGMGHPSPQLPTLQQYTLGVQSFVKDSMEERGLGVHSVLSQRVRMILYTEPNLQLLFKHLNVEHPGGWQESLRRWGVRTVRYFSNEIDAQHLYLSTLEFWLETETQKI